jgi:hypothetical protein
MSLSGEELLNLLPALYRLKDARLAQSRNLSQGPLQALLGVIAEQMAVVERDLNQLYDDQFIETCAPWVIPYIGDLIGYQPASATDGVVATVTTSRAEVAHTISYRRRKGTILVVEQIARDVTGWGAHAVEFFRVLADTQYMNHIRPHNYFAPDLRHWKARAYMDTGFDRTAHRVDVRRIATGQGRYNIQNVGIFLWSLNAYQLDMAAATPVATAAGTAACYRFSPLGADLPLFNNPVALEGDITPAAGPLNVPDRLLRQVLCRDVRKGAGAKYYGSANSLAVWIGGALVDPGKVQVCTLAGDEGHWTNLPANGSPYSVSIDPELGRLALPPAATGSLVQATYCYGFNGDLGGGPYPRAASFALQTPAYIVRVPADQPTIKAALQALSTHGGQGAVEITDSGIYREPGGLDVQVAAGAAIELRASETCRPTLLLGGALSVTGGNGSRFDLNGLLVAYAPPAGPGATPRALVVAPKASNQLSHLGLTHCTLVPGWALTPAGGPDPAYAGLPALNAECSGLDVVVNLSIVGGLVVSAQATAEVSSSLVDATVRTGTAYAGAPDPSAPATPQPGGALTLQGCTVIGKVHATLLTLVSNSILWAQVAAADQAAWPAALWAERHQQGCVRFSYLPEQAVVPGDYECVSEGADLPGPLFANLRYGQPGYGELLAQTDDAVRRGADNGGEMGAFNFQLAPLRESNLNARMQEYLPVGLEFGLFYQT